jgi:hypothetical protein
MVFYRIENGAITIQREIDGFSFIHPSISTLQTITTDTLHHRHHRRRIEAVARLCGSNYMIRWNPNIPKTSGF